MSNDKKRHISSNGGNAMEYANSLLTLDELREVQEAVEKIKWYTSFLKIGKSLILTYLNLFLTALNRIGRRIGEPLQTREPDRSGAKNSKSV